MSFKLYYDFLSQPSRALYILFKTARIPFEPVPVDLKNAPGNLTCGAGIFICPALWSLVRLAQQVCTFGLMIFSGTVTKKLIASVQTELSESLYSIPVVINLLSAGAHYSEEFAKINKFKKVPVIEHNGFILTESVAIVQYLRDMKLLPETLFPSDSKLQARVNEYLSWQQFGIRAPCALYFMLLVTDPLITGEQPSQKRVEIQTKKTVSALDTFEKKWLGNGNKYLLGDTLTVADLFGCCEIEQPRMAGYDPKKGRPNISAWMERVRSEFNPHYDEAHTIVNKIAKKREAGSSKL